GDVASIQYVDAFSVEESTITPELVRSIHAAGKKIFAWTPSTQPNIERMVRLGVDGLITDQIELTQKIRREWNALF
ncbi:glycerophosphodiester phosphodiesterase family protein, partial [Dubosiella newyorkensis]|uniref:glycerophosphodiester phosphodiesterase family protein n=1 Tax=Dubosiella newyorkensis TaxID=1862672 RepID=UPI002572D37A